MDSETCVRPVHPVESLGPTAGIGPCCPVAAPSSSRTVFSGTHLRAPATSSSVGRGRRSARNNASPARKRWGEPARRVEGLAVGRHGAARARHLAGRRPAERRLPLPAGLIARPRPGHPDGSRVRWYTERRGMFMLPMLRNSIRPDSKVEMWRASAGL
jgi:hypothetical protein